MSINIAIDGPSGAGKSSLAKSLSSLLSFIYVDTGALYRSIGLYVLRKGLSTKDELQVSNILKEINLELKFENGQQLVILNGEDVSEKIRTQEVAMAASHVSAIPSVRMFLLDLQRNIAEKNNVIMDGRDVGTVVLPNAQVKIFLTASPEKRAERRLNQLKEKGIEGIASYEQILKEIIERDHNDSTRKISPLKKADDAVLLDDTDFNEEQTLEKAMEIIRSKRDV